MTASGLQLLVQLGAERVLNSMPEGLLIAAFAWLLLRIAGRQNSGTRFAVWFSALLAIAAISFLPGFGTGRAMRHVVRPEIILPDFLAVAIVAGWILMAAMATARLAAGLWNLRKLRRNCGAIATSELPSSLRETLDQIQTIRPVVICRSSVVCVPTAIGFFKPLILVPEWVLEELSPEDLKILLLHELAHLRRWDDWTNLAQKIVRAVLCFHPAVWWIEKRLSLEREMACDDVVLAVEKNSLVYAECLVSLAEKSFVHRGLAMAQAAISHARDTSLRLARILDVHRPSATRVFKPALGVMAVFVVLCLAVLPETPTLIAFKNSALPPLLTSAGDITPQLARTPVVQTTARIENGSPFQPRVGEDNPAQLVDRSAKRLRSIAEKKRQISPHSAVLTRAAVKRPMPALQFVVVMQTHYEEGSAAVFSMCVWRVTFAAVGRNSVHQELIAQVI